MITLGVLTRRGWAGLTRQRDRSTVGLLATAYTMEQDFYTGRLRDKHDLTILVPDPPDRRLVHTVIYEEPCQGVVNDRSRAEYRRIMRDLADRGAKGILLGCTEIDPLVGPADSLVPVFDTTRLRAVELALSPTPSSTNRATAKPSATSASPSSSSPSHIGHKTVESASARLERGAD